MKRHVVLKVELANLIRRGRCVGNLYGVAEYRDGRRAGWRLRPQEDKDRAQALVEATRRELEGV